MLHWSVFEFGFFSSSRRRHTRFDCDWSSDVCSSDLDAHTLHVAGVMLYWAEGDRGSRNAARISNSDPEVLKLFMRFLRECLDVPDEQVSVTCHLFADHLDRQWEIEQFWLDALQLPRARLCKSFVNVYSKYSQKKRQNKLSYGTTRGSVHSTRVVQSIYGSIQGDGGGGG